MALKQKINSFLLTMVCFLSIAIAVNAEEPREPLPGIDYANIRLIEGMSYCSAGFGAQTVIFSINDQHVYAENAVSPYLPSANLHQSPALYLGCSLNNLVVDYSFVESSVKFNKTVIYKENHYNIAEYKLNQASVAYSLTLVPHLLYLDLGLGYSQIQYTLGFVSGGTVQSDSSIDLNDSGAFYRVSIKAFLSAHVYVHWQNQQSFDSSNTVYYANQLGLNFLVKL